MDATVTIRHESDASILESRQWVDRSLEAVFPFFADPHNLERITPAFLKFKVLSMDTPTIESGTLLRYRLKLHGLPIHWTTRIKDWNPPHSFRDVQLSGPYRLWDHTHRFERREGGTLMTDIVRFRTPFDILRRTPLLSWINRDVEAIFRYRQTVIETMLGLRWAVSAPHSDHRAGGLCHPTAATAATTGPVRAEAAPSCR
ncbi:MAG: SRPBCC family protein [Candidatus Eisenbacteria bacterium]|nr:SRPBCC family protein [Candidatus Eisenbacteria bacterium]